MVDGLKTMAFDLANDTTELWENLNQLLSDNDIALFYRVRPYDGTLLDKKQSAVETALCTARTKAENLDLEVYDWFTFTPRFVLLLGKYYEFGGHSKSIPAFVEDNFDDWWKALHLLEDIPYMSRELDVRHLLQTSPNAVLAMQKIIEWFNANRDALVAVNYSVAYLTPLLQGPMHFLDHYVGFLVKEKELNIGSLSMNSPSWWAYVKMLRDNVNIDIWPDQQKANEALVLIAEIERAAKDKPAPLKRPKEYHTWGFQNKFLWDLEHDAGFRARIFKTDPELEAKFVELGGVTDELMDWVRKR